MLVHCSLGKCPKDSLVSGNKILITCRDIIEVCEFALVRLSVWRPPAVVIATYFV